MKNKKLYEQPETQVIEMRVINQLLAGSGGTDPYTPDNNDYNW